MVNLLDFDMADRMRKAREVAGLDQRQMAETLSISRGSVSNYETRKTRPLPSILRAWAEACGVTVEWLTDATRQQRTPRIADRRTLLSDVALAA
jgi:transcriptional regulator with XRE-family HTH domain